LIIAIVDTGLRGGETLIVRTYTKKLGDEGVGVKGVGVKGVGVKGVRVKRVGVKGRYRFEEG
jgi:hypothetical protein